MAKFVVELETGEVVGAFGSMEDAKKCAKEYEDEFGLETEVFSVTE